jgi:hypothetical protein
MMTVIASLILVGLSVSGFYLYLYLKDDSKEPCGDDWDGPEIDCCCANKKADLCAEDDASGLLKIQQLTSLDRDAKESWKE